MKWQKLKPVRELLCPTKFLLGQYETRLQINHEKHHLSITMAWYIFSHNSIFSSFSSPIFDTVEHNSYGCNQGQAEMKNTLA